MTWRDDLLEAEFNGVPIFVQATGRVIGRKVIPNEYPNRDELFGEDLGRKSREYEVTAVLLGDDYLIAKNDLDAELEKPGPYTYVDPWDGEQEVIMLRPARSRESTERGGIITYTLSMVQHRERDFPRLLAPSAVLKEKAAFALAAIENDFGKRFSLGDLLAAIFRGLGKANQALSIAKGKIASKLAIIDNLTAEINSFNDSVNDLANTPQALANKWNSLVTSTKQLATTLRDNAIPISLDDGNGIGRGQGDPINVLIEATNDLADFQNEGDPDADSVDSDKEQENDSLLAQQTLVDASNVVTTAAAMADLVPNDVQQADEVADDMNAKFDELLASDISDDLFATIKDTQVALGDYLTTVAKDLPQTRTFVPATALPAVVISQIVHQTGNRDAEIIRRNAVKNPLFVQGEIEVVVSG